MECQKNGSVIPMSSAMKDDCNNTISANRLRLNTGNENDPAQGAIVGYP